MFNTKKTKISSFIVATLLTPVVLNLTIFQISTPYTYDGDWLGFWGNYSGALLGAAVAYIVANSQVEKQLKINLEQEKYNRIIIQQPALLRLKISLEKCIEELEKVSKEWNEILFAHDMIIKEAGIEYEEGPGIELHYLLDHNYQIDLLTPDINNYIEKVEKIDLHTRLIKAYYFYQEFSKAITFDNSQEWSSVAKYIEDDSGEVEIPPEESNKITLLMRQNENFSVKKQLLWEELFQKQWIKEFKSLLSDVKNEIEEIKQLREKYDPILTNKK